MSSKVPAGRPLAYQGIKESNPPQLYFRKRAPVAATDYKIYDMGDIWVDQVGQHVYMLTLKTANTGTWLQIDGGAPVQNVHSLSADGAVPVVLPDVFFNIDLAGADGIELVGEPANNRITIHGGGGGITWVDAPPGGAVMASKHGYVINGGPTTMTLPAVCPFGSTFIIAGVNGGWRMAQQAGQTTRFGNMATTPGVGGYIESTNDRDVISVVCTFEHASFLVLSSIGNLDVV